MVDARLVTPQGAFVTRFALDAAYSPGDEPATLMWEARQFARTEHRATRPLRLGRRRGLRVVVEYREVQP